MYLSHLVRLKQGWNRAFKPCLLLIVRDLAYSSIYFYLTHCNKLEWFSLNITTVVVDVLSKHGLCSGLYSQ